MSELSEAVIQRFALQEVMPEAKRLYRRAQRTFPHGSPEVWHTAMVVLLLLERAGVNDEIRTLILETLAAATGRPWEGALALFDGRYATVAPAEGPLVHLDTVELAEIEDPLRRGHRPVMSTVVHIGTIFHMCQELRDGDSDLPSMPNQN